MIRYKVTPTLNMFSHCSSTSYENCFCLDIVIICERLIGMWSHSLRKGNMVLIQKECSFIHAVYSTVVFEVEPRDPVAVKIIVIYRKMSLRLSPL